MDIETIANSSLKLSQITNIAYTRSGNSSNPTPIDSQDGYMRMVVRSDYINPSTVNGEKGIYDLVGTFTWLTLPSNRMKDGMSLYCDEIAWMSTGHTSKMTTSYYVFLNGSLKFEIPINTTFNNAEVKQEGIFFVHDLPENYYSSGMYYQVKSISHTFSGRARTKNQDAPSNFNVFAKYVHTHSAFTITPSFSWSLGSSYPGVSVDFAYGLSHTTYSVSNYTEYSPY